MPRMENKAVPEGNGPAPHQEEFGYGQPTLVENFRKLEEIWDRKIYVLTNLFEQRLTSLEPDARQPRLAMAADGHANTKTRECTEGATTAVQTMHGDSCSATRVDPGPKTHSTSFGMKAEPPDLPCREDVLFENGAAAPKSCLPLLKMRTIAAAGGLIPTGEISTAPKTTLNQPPRRLSTEEADCKKTLTPYVSYDSSFFQNNNLPAAPFCRRVIETKSGENMTFGPGGSLGRLRACPVLGSWHVLLCGEVMRFGAAV